MQKDSYVSPNLKLRITDPLTDFCTVPPGLFFWETFLLQNINKTKNYFPKTALYQTFILMALMGRLYVTCIIGLLPDKKLETYESFFGLIWNYLSQNNLPNNFADGFFMTDFEQNIRSGFQLFWPEVRLLGCYFHFSQLIWRRVKS